MRPPPRKLPLDPAHPERVCWGCDRYCAWNDLACGNGSDRAQHPKEIFGPGWHLTGTGATPDANGRESDATGHDDDDGDASTGDPLPHRGTR